MDLCAARVRRLAARLAVDLAGGHVIVGVDEVDDVSDWRAAARAAGRARGWRIRTGVSPDGGRVWACREDLEPSPAWLARKRRWFADASTRSCRIHTDLPDPA